MTIELNTSLVRLALGCIQPASASDVLGFLGSTFGADGIGITLPTVEHLFQQWVEAGEIVCVHRRQRLHSLTLKGDTRLSQLERRQRDRTRLFLLKELRNVRLRLPDAEESEKADVSSVVFVESSIQEARPKGAAASPRIAPVVGRAFWPHLSRQLSVGSSTFASGPRFRFLSFPSVIDCCKAASLDSIPERGISYTEVALALGVSPSLLLSFQKRPENFYREFEIQKANGKKRVITAPRTMLKVTQYFLLDYFLCRIAVHPCATAFTSGSSVKKNAEMHVGKKFVANIDVCDFFPSISLKLLAKSLIAAGLKPATAILISRLATYNGGLPQGAPTSSALSNIFMYDFDVEVSRFCGERSVTYSRYADDMTFSSNEKAAIEASIAFAEKCLASLSLKLNPEKTRIFTSSTRQVVTGVVVNEFAQPSRAARRLLRAQLHQASVNPTKSPEGFDYLQGKVAYMKSFATVQRSIGSLPNQYVTKALATLKAHRNQTLEKEQLLPAQMEPPST